MEKKVETLESNLCIVLRTVEQLTDRLDTIQNRRPCDKECQTNPIRKNVTERGNQIKPATTDTGTQCEPVNSVAINLLKSMKQIILPALAQPKMMLKFKDAQQRGVVPQEAVAALEHIVTQKFSTEDVINAVHACAIIAMIDSIVEEGGESSSSEYETGTETGTETEYESDSPLPQNSGGTLYYKVRNGV